MNRRLVLHAPIAYDFALASHLPTHEGLAEHLPHPDHRTMVTVAEQLAGRLICVYELQTGTPTS